MKCTNSIATDYLSAYDVLEGVSDKYKVHSIKADEAYDIKECIKNMENTILSLLFGLVTIVKFV